MGIDPESILGIKLAVLKTAAAGTVLGIVWRREFNLSQAIPAALSGLASAIYVAPFALSSAGITTPEIRDGGIFIFGLLGMYVIDGLTYVGRSFARNPFAVWRRVRNPDLPDDDKGGGSP